VNLNIISSLEFSSRPLVTDSGFIEASALTNDGTNGFLNCGNCKRYMAIGKIRCSGTKIHRALEYTKKTARRAAIIGTMIALPLVAPLIGGCRGPGLDIEPDAAPIADASEPDNRIPNYTLPVIPDASIPDASAPDAAVPPDHCLSHEAGPTVVINQETDGRVARIRDLNRITREFITPELVDFLNETHVYGTEPIPPDMTITLQRDPNCMTEPQVAQAIAMPEEAYGEERGIYTIHQIGLETLRRTDRSVFQIGAGIMFHELGHPQPGGEAGYIGEVIAGINNFEQTLDAFVVFANQGNGTSDITWWASNIDDTGGDMSLWTHLADQITYLSIGLDVCGCEAHDRANMFFFRRLLALDGDFRALRDDVLSLMRGGHITDAIQEGVQEFIDYYISRRYPGEYQLQDAELELRMVFFHELYRRFGPDMAMAYLEATSHAPPQVNGDIIGIGEFRYGRERHSDKIYSYIPGDMSCTSLEQIHRTVITACDGVEDRCEDIAEDRNVMVGSGVELMHERGYTYLGCISGDESGEVTKWVMRVMADRYYDETGGYLWIGDNPWDAVQRITVLRSLQINVTDPCYRLDEY